PPPSPTLFPYTTLFRSASGIDLPDHFGLPQAGTRVDWAASRNDELSIDAGTLDGSIGSTPFQARIPATFLVKASHVLARWKHSRSEEHTSELQSRFELV